MKYLVGVLGMLMLPLAVIFVSFKASCSFVSRWASKGLESFDD